MNMEMLQSIPIFIWVLVPAIIAFALSFTLLKSLRLSIYVTVMITGIIMLMVVFIYYLEYLDNHFIGSYDDTGLPSAFSSSGWRLILDSWPLWSPPVLYLGLLIACVTWFLKPEKTVTITETLSQTTQAPGSAMGSQELIKAKLENEKLKHRLAVTEEKFRIIKERGGSLSSKDTRTTLDIKQLREQLVNCKRDKEVLKKEIGTLTKDLERTNHLVDQLLEEKYG